MGRMAGAGFGAGLTIGWGTDGARGGGKGSAKGRERGIGRWGGAMIWRRGGCAAGLWGEVTGRVDALSCASAPRLT